MKKSETVPEKNPGMQKEERVHPEFILLCVTIAVIVVCFLFGTSGSVMAPSECRLLVKGWHYEDTYGRVREIDLPLSEGAAPDLEAVTISRRLPETIDSDQVLGVYSSFQEIEVRIGGKAVERYDHNRSLLATNIPANQMRMIKLSPEDGGRLLEIRYSSKMTGYKLQLNPVLIGNRAGIIGYQLERKQAVATEGLIVILTGIVMLLLGIAYPKRYRDGGMRLYGALLVLFIGIWLLLQAGIGQLFCEDQEAAHFVELMMLFLIPIPAVRFEEAVLNYRFWKAADFVCAVDLMALIFALFYALILHRDLMEILTLSHLIIAANVLFSTVIFLVIVARHREEVPGLRWIIAALRCLFAGTVAEALMFYLMPRKENGQIFGAFVVAFAFFALYWLIQSGRNEAAARENTLRQTRANEMFFSNMSHEVRTPIHTVTGLTELILKDAEEAVIKDAEEMKGSGNRLLALVNQILLLSRIRAGSIRIEHEPFEMIDLLVRFYEYAEGRREPDRIRVAFLNDPDLPSRVLGDEEQILNLLRNIADHAFNHMEEGEVRLTVGKYEKKGKLFLHVRVESDSDQIVPEDPSALFDLSSTIAGGRPALALPLAKQLADLLGGRIELCNPQPGTLSVTAALPVEPLRGETVGVISMSPESKSFADLPYIPGARVLLVDDEPMSRNVMKGVFRNTGVVLDTCSGGEEALLQLRRQKYDLIILDYLMPGMDGFEVMSHIRCDEGLPGDTVPVILMTADDSPGVRERMKQAGFADGLPKPVTGSEINHVLLRYLANRKGGRE